MIRWNRLLSGVGITAIILSGCGTAQTSEQQKNGSSQSQAEMTKTKDKKTETVHRNVSNGGSGNLNSKSSKIGASSQPTVRLLEQKISYNINGMKKEETAFLKHASNDAYSLYVLPEYELSAEEPNRDLLSLKSDGSIFMRIETLSDDVDMNSAKETMKTELAAINAGAKEIQVPQDEFFQNAAAMEVTKDGDVVTSYVIPESGIKVKLTLYTKQTSDNRDAFLQMAKTIVKEKGSN